MIPTGSPTRARTMPKWGWLLIIAGVIALVIALPPVGIVLSLTVIGFAMFALVKKTPTLLRFGSAKRAMLASSVAVVALFISGVAATAAARPDPVAPAALLDTQQSAAPVQPAPTAAAADEAKPAPATAESAPAPAATPAPAPKPVTVVSQVSESQAIPFGQQRVDDAAYAQGTEQVTVAGANGERVITYEITTVDGVETARTVISDVVT